MSSRRCLCGSKPVGANDDFRARPGVYGLRLLLKGVQALTQFSELPSKERNLCLQFCDTVFQPSAFGIAGSPDLGTHRPYARIALALEGRVNSSRCRVAVRVSNRGVKSPIAVTCGPFYRTQRAS
jgi:hypothetical protein